MNDPHVERLLQDVEVDAASRELAGHLYRAALAEGKTPDEALDLAAAALRKMRAQWTDACAGDTD